VTSVGFSWRRDAEGADDTDLVWWEVTNGWGKYM
jgi:hypothetical protein